ncbi:MAG: substrate-binding domain-containing protein [Clostridiales Family XIII bacterium]|jgi:ribose transport system substrate-binding protein|nr:substrate-binding domain-containing protein [Clostridiales Family XIII bacterium]
MNLIKHIQTPLLVASIMILIVTCLLTFAQKSATEETLQISVIVREETEDFGQSPLRHGIEDAASSINAELTFRSLKDIRSEQEYIELLSKEIANAPDYLLLEPFDTDGLANYLDKISKKTKIVFVNASISSRNADAVVADNRHAGKMLGDEVVFDSRGKAPVLIIKTDFNYSDTRYFYNGVIEALKDNGIAFDVRQIRSDDQQKQFFQLLQNTTYSSVVFLDTTQAEYFAHLKKVDDRLEHINLYGFGINNNLLPLIDEGVMRGVSVTDQYHIGYQSVFTAYGRPMSEDEENLYPVKEIVVTKYNLFDSNHESLLFPKQN